MKRTKRKTELFKPCFCIPFILAAILLFFTLPVWAQSATQQAKINFESFESLKSLPYMGGSLMFNGVNLNYGHLNIGGKYPVRFSAFTKVPIPDSESHEYKEIMDQVQFGVMTVTDITNTKFVFSLARWDYAGNSLSTIAGRLDLNKPGLDVNNDGLADLEYVSSINPARPESRNISYLRLISSEAELRAAMYFYAPTMDPGQPNKAGGNVGFNIQGFALFRQDFMDVKTTSSSTQSLAVQTLALRDKKIIPQLNLVAGDYVITVSESGGAYNRVQSINPNKGLLTFKSASGPEDSAQIALAAIQLMVLDIGGMEDANNNLSNGTLDSPSSTNRIRSAASDPDYEKYIQAKEQCYSIYNSMPIKIPLRLNFLEDIPIDIRVPVVNRKIGTFTINKDYGGIGVKGQPRIDFGIVSGDITTMILQDINFKMESIFEEYSEIDLPLSFKGIEPRIAIDGAGGVILHLDIGLAFGLKFGLTGTDKGGKFEFNFASIRLKGNRTKFSVIADIGGHEKLENYDIFEMYTDKKAPGLWQLLEHEIPDGEVSFYVKPYFECSLQIHAFETAFAKIKWDVGYRNNLTFEILFGHLHKIEISSSFEANIVFKVGFGIDGYTIWSYPLWSENWKLPLFKLIIYQDDSRLADLVVTELLFNTADLVPGQNVKFFATIKNIGMHDPVPGGRSNVRFLVDGNALGDFKYDVGPGGTATIPKLNPGESYTGECSQVWTVQEGAAHTFTAIADPANVIEELDEANNTKVISLNNDLFLSDLLISDLWLEPANPAPGQAVKAYATIKNIGIYDTDLYQNVVVKFLYDGIIMGYFEFPHNSEEGWKPLKAGESYTGECSGIWIAQENLHTFTAIADPDNLIKESNEGNNTKEITLNDNDQLSDVIVTGISVNPANPMPGQWVSISATIKNIGTGRTPNGVDVGTGFWVDSVYLGYFFSQDSGGRILSLNPGQTYTGTCYTKWIATAGNHTINAIVDDVNRFPESNEENNSLLFTFTTTQGCGYLAPDKSLNLGDMIYSCDGRFRLMLQHDGNLVFSEVSNSAVRWASCTDGKGVVVAYMQGDGNLVLSNQSGSAVWSTRTDGHPGAWLALQDDGNLVIYYAPQMVAIWASHTPCN